jgi:hypothetical protein
MVPQAVMWERRLREIRERNERLFRQYVARLKEGEVLIKYDERRKPQQRRFSVSPDEALIMWGKPGDKSTRARAYRAGCARVAHDCGWAGRAEPLAEVIAMHYGPFSNRFRYYNCGVNKAWLCFVVELESRTLDIVCENVEQLTRWFMGIQSLAPLNSTYMSRGALIWARAGMIVRSCWPVAQLTHAGAGGPRGLAPAHHGASGELRLRSCTRPIS